MPPGFYINYLLLFPLSHPPVKVSEAQGQEHSRLNTDTHLPAAEEASCALGADDAVASEASPRQGSCISLTGK